VKTLSYDGLEAGASLAEESVPVSIPVDILNSYASRDLGDFTVENRSSGLDYLALIFGGKQHELDHITYFPWDLDNDDVVSSQDVIHAVNHLGATQSEDNFDSLIDFNGDGIITPTDAIAVINRLGYSTDPTITEI